MGADAGGGGVVRRAHEAKARKSRGHSRGVARLFEPGDPEADRDRPRINVAEASLCQHLVDNRAQGGDRGGEIDMDVRRGPARLHEQLSLGVAQPRPAAGGAAINSEIERPAAHAASPCSDRSTIAAAAARSASAALAGVSRSCARSWRRLLRRHGQMHEDGGDRRASCRRDTATLRSRGGCRQILRRPSTPGPEFPPLGSRGRWR